MTEQLPAAHWNDLAILGATAERHEREARNNIAWGLEQLEFGRATFRSTARF